MIAPNLTFNYEFEAETQRPVQLPEAIATQRGVSAVSHQDGWGGQGRGGAYFGATGGIAGPEPKFELCSGWFTLRPSERWTPNFSCALFSDYQRPRRDGTTDRKESNKLQNAAATRPSSHDWETMTRAPDYPRPDYHPTRDVSSYSVFVGEGLEKVLKIGDALNFSRDGNGDFRYCVLRSGETVVSAGSVGRTEGEGPFTIWQEYDRHPNPNAEAVKAKLQPKGSFFAAFPVAEWIDVHRPHVTVRIKDQIFHLVDGQDVHVDPYYVFLARSNRNLPPIAFEFSPRAVHSAGRLDVMGKDLIVDATRHLMADKTMLL